MRWRNWLGTGAGKILMWLLFVLAAVGVATYDRRHKESKVSSTQRSRWDGEGYAAGANGFGTEGCPYADGAARECWVNGWRRGTTDRQWRAEYRAGWRHAVNPFGGGTADGGDRL